MFFPLMSRPSCTIFEEKTTECTLTATTVTRDGNQEKTENVDSTIQVTYDGSTRRGTHIEWDYEVSDETEITGVEVYCPDLKFQSHSDFAGTAATFGVIGPDGWTYDYVKTAGVTRSGVAITVGLAAAALAFFM